MLSKDEILKKKGRSPEQLDLVKDLDTDKSKIKNRLLLVLILFLFVGSSSSLWIYREYKMGNLTFSFSFPKINPPITTDKNIWQICFFDKTGQTLLFNQNCNDTKMPESTIKNNIDLIKSSLPNGLIISENISTSSTEIKYSSDISSPKFNYYLSVNIYGSYPLDVSQSLIPKLANDLYWKYSNK